MINELSKLAEAMEKSGIQAQNWHRKYKLIRNIQAKAPCIRILIDEGSVLELSSIDKTVGAGLRKYGSNQGTYPCMNLAPLYRITDSEVNKKLSSLHPEDLDESKIIEIKNWCTENNWGRKFQDKFKISIEKMTNELVSLIPDFEPIKILKRESDFFVDADILHQELENKAFEMLRNRVNVSLALNVLFYFNNSGEKAANDYGSVSVAFDTPKLIERGIPAVSHKFTQAFNTALLSSDLEGLSESGTGDIDAFGIAFEPSEKPMPEVKLAGGFDVKLRTMFKGQPCQTRYGKLENASYPISPKMRKKLQTALEWLGGSAERKNVTWLNTDKNEVLFAYPATLPEAQISYTRMFKRSEKKDAAFEEQAKRFLTEICRGKKPGSDSNAEKIQLFILKKIDKGRTKVVYTRQTDPYELERQSEAWIVGSMNIPPFAFGQPDVPFPLDTADILNRFWNQKGAQITKKGNSVPKYHGMELLMDSQFPVASDLHYLAEKAMTIGVYLENMLATGNLNHPIWENIKDMLALMGLLLYRDNIRKDSYMESLPYLYGQLLKVSDELHALYCNVVRDGELPIQLAGGSLYQAAADSPIRTLNLLGQRMNPYILWAKTYRIKDVSEKGKESWKAGWLIFLYEKIASELFSAWGTSTRFNDEEKALLFIGYLANFPKRDKGTGDIGEINNSEEANSHERYN